MLVDKHKLRRSRIHKSKQQTKSTSKPVTTKVHAVPSQLSPVFPPADSSVVGPKASSWEQLLSESCTSLQTPTELPGDLRNLVDITMPVAKDVIGPLSTTSVLDVIELPVQELELIRATSSTPFQFDETVEPPEVPSSKGEPEILLTEEDESDIETWLEDLIS
ncbi:hypothetical protein P9112_004816 [Eukaryota sp. TZLM1-RC]